MTKYDLVVNVQEALAGIGDGMKRFNRRIFIKINQPVNRALRGYYYLPYPHRRWQERYRPTHNFMPAGMSLSERRTR